jgi:hypothetical protein
LTKFPPFDECEDYYDFYDHVTILCKEHGVCLDDEGYLLDVDLDTRVKALLEVYHRKENFEYNIEQLGIK